MKLFFLTCAFIGLHQYVAAQTPLMQPDAYPALWTVHAVSVAMLIAFIGLIWSSRISVLGEGARN